MAKRIRAPVMAKMKFALNLISTRHMLGISRRLPAMRAQLSP
jgi:hypothetical protein